MGSAEIQLAGLRQIVFWPLTFDPKEPDTSELAQGRPVENFMAQFKAAMQNGTHPWHLVEDRLQYLKEDALPPEVAQSSSPYAYHELVYFHDFVTDFLFGTASNGHDGCLELYERQDLKDATVSLLLKRDKGGIAATKEINLAVDRCMLYVTRPGVVILVLETHSLDRLSLADALRLSEAFRRAYPPYFTYHKKAGWVLPDLYPDSVTWHWKDKTSSTNKTSSTKMSGPSAEACRAGATEKRAPLLAPWWTSLLPGFIQVTGMEATNADALRFRHVIDERMPLMSFVQLASKQTSAIPPISRISEGDWARLCFVDLPGKNLPYHEEFLPDFEAKHCYDRFKHWGTRYLLSPYSFIVVTDDEEMPSFTLSNHFRRMYFQMMLLTQLEFAAYITFSSRISGAVSNAEKNGSGGFASKRFRERILAIEEEFMEFVHQFRFTGVSNQIQAQELYGKIREQMRLTELFQDVKAELETATSYIFAKTQFEQAKAAERLNVMLTIVAVVGLAFAAVSTTLFFDGGVVTKDGAFNLYGWRFLADLLPLGSVLVISSVAALWLSDNMMRYGRNGDANSDRVRGVLKWIVGIGFALATVGGITSLVAYLLNG
ncbi:hypothetical protein [Breoghania sp.]|uniref:hypothetical protein n=1 Tax=Breoghania sp. TaxID=2065378 RepID=UPI002AA943B3|nr:hypothetical protein [Breoghania sp.]